MKADLKLLSGVKTSFQFDKTQRNQTKIVAIVTCLATQANLFTISPNMVVMDIHGLNLKEPTLQSVLFGTFWTNSMQACDQFKEI